jgi:hypothetical protein
MKSVIYCDAILAQSNILVFHRGEEREEIFEATSRVKSNEWTCLCVLRAGRTKKKREKKKNTWVIVVKKISVEQKKAINMPLYTT